MAIGETGLCGVHAARHAAVEPREELAFATTLLQLMAELIVLEAHQDYNLATPRLVLS